MYYKRTEKCEQIKWRTNIGWTIGMLGLYSGTSGFASNALLIPQQDQLILSLFDSFQFNSEIKL